MGKRDRSDEPKRPGRKRADLVVNLKVETIPMPNYHLPAWRAGVKILLKFMKQDMGSSSDEVTGGDSAHEDK
jgi:hypothetical protein